MSEKWIRIYSLISSFSIITEFSISQLPSIYWTPGPRKDKIQPTPFSSDFTI